MSATGEHKSAVECARAATDAVRDLNRATIHRGGYTWPADLDAVIGALGEAAYAMVQALEQARRWLTTSETLGRVGHDQDAHVGTAVIDADDLLCTAIGSAAGLSADLDAARQITAHFTGIDPDPTT